MKHMLKITLLPIDLSMVGLADPLTLETCVEDKMDSLKYQEILGGNVMLSVRKLKLGSHWTLQ